MKKKSVLILYNNLFHYRVPIWNILAKDYDIKVVYSYPAKKEIIEQCDFETEYIPVKKLSKLLYHKKSIAQIAKDYDVVLSDGQVTFIDYSWLALRKRDYKLIYWCIGAPASYNRHYGDAGKGYYMVNDFFHKKADAMVFYSDVPIDSHVNRGYKRDALFVANNTVQVEKIDINWEGKESLLFIGTLYMEKGLQQLLEAYKAANGQNLDLLPLTIVGGGNQFDVVRNWVANNNLTEKIHLTGPIYDQKEKAQIFAKSIACISPLQAGLSVLESMGYGVPFITSFDAITGGEAFNITNEVTGLRIDDISKLSDVINDINLNPQKYIEMGKKAYSHYWSCRKPEDMAKGLSDAIEYVISYKK